VAIEHEIGLVEQKLITKYAGHEDQLSFKHWGMDRFRVLALEKLLNSSLDKLENEQVINILLQKYKVLLKGAVKHKKTLQIKKSPSLRWFHQIFTPKFINLRYNNSLIN